MISVFCLTSEFLYVIMFLILKTVKEILKMSFKKFLLALGLAAATLGMASCSESFDPVNPVIYLEAGAEKGNGTETKPYGDILDAIVKAKELGLAGAEHITLNFGAGDYSLTETLTLSSEDLGGASLEMICEDEEKAIVGAWLPVTGFTETEVNGVKAWVADMPQLNGETVYSHQFFSSDYERLQRPRYPEEGFLRNEFAVGPNGEQVPPKGLAYVGTDVYVSNTSFYFYEGDIPEDLTRLEDIQVCMFHYWDDSRQTVKKIDYENNLLLWEGYSNPVESDGLGARYYLDNVYEYLNSPGEVYNDRESGKLYYIPHSDDSIDGFKLFASTIDTMLFIDGMNGSVDKNSLTVKNIGFAGSDWKDVSRIPYQAAQDIIASIQVSNSSYMLFENCSFNHIGNYAVEMKKNVNNVIFDHCTVSDVGGGGFRISGANIVPVTEEVPHDITITDCTINGYGRIHRNAIGVLIQYAHDCIISHNEISDGFYSGMSVGWVWGYSDHATSNIIIEKNHIYNIGQGVLSDMGGIYTLGVQPGTVLRGNLIHDIKSFGYGGWAYYTDEGSSDILIEKNIGYNCTDTVYHHHYGANNIVRNNIFAFGDLGCVKSSKVEDHVSFTLERNILINNFAPIYFYDDDKESFVDDSNLVWDYTLKEKAISSDVELKGRTENWLNYTKEKNKENMIKYGFYNNAVFSDPLFADPFNYDFTLAEDSPAWDIGFEPIDMSDVGPRN